MAQVVLLSERAGELVDLGKSRLNALRLQRRTYATSYLATRHGYIIAQIAGAVERVLIDNRPPYLILDVLQADEDDGVPRFKPTMGGLSGEPYVRTGVLAPPELAGATLYQASTQYQCTGRYAYSVLTSALAGYNYGLVAVVVTDTETNKMRLVYAQQSYVSAVIGEAQNAFAPLGRSGDGSEYMAYSFHNKTDDDDDESWVSITLAKHNTDDDMPPETTIWPILGENDGYYNDLAPVTLMVNAGRMRLAWFQEYQDTLDDDGEIEHRGADPKVVVYNAASGSYTATSFRSLTPELEAFFDTDPDAYHRLRVNRGLAYCGDGVLLMCFMYREVPGAEKMYLFRSTNYGGSWTKISLPVVDGELPGVSATNLHSLRSLAPGKVMLRTNRGSETRLYYSDDAGASWGDYGVVDMTQGSRQFGRYMTVAQAVRRKRGLDFVYTATHHEPSEGKVYELMFDSFHPAATLIGDPVLISDRAAYTDTDYRYNSSAYAEKGAPLLQGYPNELEGESE